MYPGFRGCNFVQLGFGGAYLPYNYIGLTGVQTSKHCLFLWYSTKSNQSWLVVVLILMIISAIRLCKSMRWSPVMIDCHILPCDMQTDRDLRANSHKWSIEMVSTGFVSYFLFRAGELLFLLGIFFYVILLGTLLEHMNHSWYSYPFHRHYNWKCSYVLS
jgi:hypothetical protein